MKALAGDDDNPAVEGFDPDVSAELYTTNGDMTGDAWEQLGTQAYTVELDGGAGPAVGGTDAARLAPARRLRLPGRRGGRAGRVREEPRLRAGPRRVGQAPGRARQSHLGNTAPDFVPTTFSISYGDPQTVEVNAKRSLGSVTRVLADQRRRACSAATRGVPGRRALRQARHLLPPAARPRDRGQGGRQGPGVVHGRGDDSSTPFTYTVTKRHRQQGAADDAPRTTPAAAPTRSTSRRPYAGPLYQDDYEQALKDAGIGYDVYDVDAQAAPRRRALGVLATTRR